MTNPPEILIRAGSSGDLPAIAAIQFDSPQAAGWPVTDYLAYDLRVAECQGQVAAYLVTRTVAPCESEILDLAVAPASRRRGLAKALLTSFLKGYKGSVFLEVRASNTAARQMYKSLEFQEVTLRKGYYDNPLEPAIVMKFHSC